MNTEPAAPRSFLWRILPLALVITTLILVGKLTPLGNYMTVAYLKDLILGAGVWGIFIFIGAFVACALMNLPCSFFLVVGVLVFGYAQGALLTYIAAMLAAMLTFYFARFMSGSALSQIRNPRVKRLISQAESRPIRTLLLLRTLMQLSPLVGYTMALTGMKARNYFIGNLIGILIPIAYLTLAVFLLKDQLGAWLGM